MKKIKKNIGNTRFTTAFGKTLKRLLLSGVGVHHAGMLPRYRRLVEKLAQAGLLPIICGTDTLGVGINVPIHTVLLTQLTKFDGHRERRLRAREFHQIAGRAGRSGYDNEGMVIAQATEYDIENAKALAKAGGDPKKARKIKTKTPPKGFVSWNKQTFEKLIEAEPEALKPRLKILHSMVLCSLERGGDVRAHMVELIENSEQSADEKRVLIERLDAILTTLIDAEVCSLKIENGESIYELTRELPDDFQLNQPLSPFLLASLELLDKEDENYSLDLISLVESTLESPPQILRALERIARDKAWREMAAEGIEFEERQELIKEVTFEKPLDDLIDEAFSAYVKEVPWALDYRPEPKSILRNMLEMAADFKGYIQAINIPRAEGVLLRYLTDCYRALSRTVPKDYLTDQLEEIIRWLSLVVYTIDSSLLDEWAGLDSAESETEGFKLNPEALIADRAAFTLLVRNALFRRVRLAATDYLDTLGELDEAWGWRRPRWEAALDAFYEAHDEILLDADARSARFFTIDSALEEQNHSWCVTQMFKDADDDYDFGIKATVDIDATQAEGEVIFSSYKVGFIEDLLDD